MVLKSLLSLPVRLTKQITGFTFYIWVRGQLKRKSSATSSRMLASRDQVACMIRLLQGLKWVLAVAMTDAIVAKTSSLTQDFFQN